MISQQAVLSIHEDGVEGLFGLAGLKLVHFKHFPPVLDFLAW